MTGDARAALAERVAGAYAALPDAYAVALGGSLATAVADAGSDVDLYVYAPGEVPLEARAAVARASATRAEVDNRFWESGDEWLDAETGVHVDVMFRSTGWIEGELARTLERCEASVGFSTCLWHNVLSSSPLYDRSGWYAALQERARQPYPEALRRAVIAKNHPILRSTLSSYRYQIAAAVRRGDPVSVNHRVAALLASYFDVLFALNRLPNPGEKRLLDLAEATCAAVPVGMCEGVRALLAARGDDVLERVDALLDGLDDLLRAQGVLESLDLTERQ